MDKYNVTGQHIQHCEWMVKYGIWIWVGLCILLVLIVFLIGGN